MSETSPSGIGAASAAVKLKRGKEGPIRAGHPWVFSGAIAAVEGSPEAGAVVRVRDDTGTVLGVGLYNPRGSIAVRLVAGVDEPVDAALVRRRVSDALTLRRRMGLVGESSAFRLLNGEGDGLPGVVADVYDRFVSLQLLNAGAERLRGLVLDALDDVLEPRGVFERSTGGARREEGLEDRVGLASGQELPERVEIREEGVIHLVDVRRGQKTGFFLDQRANRAQVGRLASGLRVLDCFAYTGGFSLAAAKGGAARVTAIETSGPALELARAAAARNEIPEERIEWRAADVFDVLVADGSGRERPDLIVLDPPPFARHRSDRDRAVRAYRDLNRRALRTLAPGGMLFTFSCSPHVTRELFVHVVATSAPPGTRLQVLASVGAGPDHPVLPAHPEGEYLSGLLVRAIAD
ncbi:MAG: class I SAM-dependent rRNA methyltransferase [Deltaproteobacteria bacterium]|nr:class I SAM-dependent rRNA methyltransferase [Deltaproteobacteria bacterium]